MFLIEPQPTAYDLRFPVAGIPVRVHPLFWLAAVLLGAQGGDGTTLLIWVGVVFVSILAHELGHALAYRYYGQASQIVLYLMGGLTIAAGAAGGSSWGRPRLGPQGHAFISAAGPAAGFLLATVIIGLVFAAGGAVDFHFTRGFLPGWDVQLRAPPQEGNFYWYVLIEDLLYVNIFWGLVNLLPVYPLDGGQIAREWFASQDPWNGTARALWLSVCVSGAMAVVSLLLWRSIFMALLFGSLAFSNYQALQQSGGRP